MASRAWWEAAISSSGATSRPLWPAWRPATAWPGAAAEPAKQPEELFEDVEGSELTAAGATWRIQVFSIIDDEGGRWIQLGLTGPCQDLATLQLPPGGNATHVALALNDWFEDRRLVDLA